MKYFLLRHTKPDIAEGICYGQTDVDVLPSFEQEKVQVLKKLKNIKFDRIYSSPLKRCARLADSIKLSDTPICLDNRLKEMNFGVWELKPWAEIEKTEAAKKWFEDYIHLPASDGESYMDLLKRVRHFINDTQEEKEIESLLLVCHRGVIGAFYTIINNLNPFRAFELEIGFGDIIELEQIGHL